MYIPEEGREGEMSCPGQAERQVKVEQIPPSSGLCSIQALGGLDNARPHWGGQCVLLNPQIKC